MSQTWLKRVAHTVQIVVFLFLIPLFLVLIPYRLLREFFKKRLNWKPNIIWGPRPIISISHNRSADRLFGYRSDCIVYDVYHITKNSTFDYDVSPLIKNRITYLFTPFAILVWVAVRYDIIQMFYTGGFLYLNPVLLRAELILWRLLRVRTIAMAYGADVRQESITRALGKYHAYLDMTHEQVINETGLTEIQIRKRVEFILRWASVSISMGDMIEYTPGSKNDVYYWAIDVHDWKPVYEPNNEKIVIVHAPNSPHYKGTRFLMEAIEKLKAEGHDIEFVLVRGMTNDEARRHYERADIFAEQFIIGFHGLTAIEAMALGKPVLCYIRKPPQYLPAFTECPIVNTDPDNLYENLKKLVEDAKWRRELGVAGRKYVEKYWSLRAVGARFDEIYQSVW